MRHALKFAALAAGGLLAAGVAAPAALAADDCPNAAVRAQQNAERLPNCMAYEQVSPADKNGATPIAEAITDDGDRVLFRMNSGTADPLSFLDGKYRATRAAEGWATRALMPPFDGRYPKGTEVPSQVAWSSDLERILLSTNYPLNENDRGTQANGNGSLDLYLREADGSFTWVVPDPSVVDNNTVLTVDVMRGSSDLDRIVLSTARQFDPRVMDTSVTHNYVWTRNGMQLATVLPDGSLPDDLPLNYAGQTRNPRAASADGRRVAFTVGSGPSAGIYVRFNADDPETAVTREVAVGPNGETCSGANLIGLSDDGTKLLFRCANALVPGALPDALYLRDLDGGPSAVRSFGMAGESGTIIGATPDFSRMYLRGGGGAVFLSRNGEQATAVVTPLVGGSMLNHGYVSRDGEYLAFASQNDYGFDRGASGSLQVYRYALGDEELTCVSCHADGSPTTGTADVAGSISNAVLNALLINPVTNAGTVAFTTTTDLDPRDTNGVDDAYAWIDGRYVLLSDGRDREPSIGMGGGPDGRSFFVVSAAALAADDADGGGFDLYMARPNGGFLVPDAPAPCTANCQDPTAERPGAPGVGSVDFVGRGNLLEQATAPTKRATTSVTTAAKLKGSRVTVRVKVSGAGSIRVSGSGLRQTTVKAKKAGTYSVAVRLSAHGLAQQRKRGRLVTRATARFTPTAGAPVKAGRSLTVAAATKKGGR